MRPVEVRTDVLAGAAAALRAAASRLPDATREVRAAGTGESRLDEAVYELCETVRRNARGLAFDLDRVAVTLTLAAAGYDAVEGAAVR
jgi:hypothetical protein